MPNDVMLVFGGSRGIGAAVARMAAARGWQVAFTYNSGSEQAEQIVAEIAAAGGHARAMACNVGAEADIAGAVKAAQAMGTLRALVYSSGITGGSCNLAEVEADVVAQVVAVNLTGAIIAAREGVRAMSTRLGGAGGAITFVSSRAAERGSAGAHVWYAATKGGVNSLAIGLAREVATEGVRVNCVSPGPVATDMLSAEQQARGAANVPIQRVARPEEIAEAVMFISSDAASYVTGSNLVAAGGA